MLSCANPLELDITAQNGEVLLTGPATSVSMALVIDATRRPCKVCSKRARAQSMSCAQTTDRAFAHARQVRARFPSIGGMFRKTADETAPAGEQKWSLGPSFRTSGRPGPQNLLRGQHVENC